MYLPRCTNRPAPPVRPVRNFANDSTRTSARLPQVQWPTRTEASTTEPARRRAPKGKWDRKERRTASISTASPASNPVDETETFQDVSTLSEIHFIALDRPYFSPREGLGRGLGGARHRSGDQATGLALPVVRATGHSHRCSSVFIRGQEGLLRATPTEKSIGHR